MRTALLFVVPLLGLSAGPDLAAQERPGRAPREIAAATRPGVVLVTARSAGEVIGRGSGFLVSSDGGIVTNRHVIEGAEALSIQLASGEIYDNVYFISDDERRDLVILRIPATDLPSLQLGNDRAIQVGDPVFVMGNPMGLDGTFSDGLVSARRTVSGVDLIQMTAPISPGSSGGPVLDEAGAVVGVATLTLREGQNLNMAVPVRYVAGLMSVPDEPRPFDEVAANFARELPGTVVQPDASLRSIATGAEDEMPLWQQVLLSEMTTVHEAAEQMGYIRSHEPYWDMLDEGETAEIDYTFDGRGDWITVIAVCDVDCGDLDLSVVDSSGAEVSDVTTSDRPEVRFQVIRAGAFKVQVAMYQCSVEPCGFGVQSYIEPGT